MDCPHIAGQRCPAANCIGLPDPKACDHIRRHREWAAKPREEQIAILASRRKVAASLRVRGYGDSSTGYGQMTAWLMKGLEASGIATAFEPIHFDETRVPLDPWLRSRMVGPSPASPALQMAVPESPLAAGSIALTMWESTRISPRAVEMLNGAKAVVVPCQANADWFRASGVKAPIRVVPEGIDPALYRPTSPEPDQVVKFGAAGRMAHGGARKGLEDVVAAFLAAFPGRQDVRLEVKCWPDCPIAEPTDPRITLNRKSLSDDEMADWYRSLSVFCSASKGEGWGLQPHQAMAVGRPVIAPIWGGHAAYMTPEATYAVEFDEVPALAPYEGRGNWCVPRMASLVDRMRQAASDPATRRAKGEAAACRAAEFTWERAARELASVVREFGLWMAPYDPGRERAIKLLILGCDYRGGPATECGCTKTRICLAGNGRPIPGTDATDVTDRDCRACVTA